MRLRLGTDETEAATASLDWFAAHGGLVGRFGRLVAKLMPFARKVGAFGARGIYPSGTGHAVPEGAVTALCGAAPAHLWRGPFNPRSRVVTPCDECVWLATALD